MAAMYPSPDLPGRRHALIIATSDHHDAGLRRLRSPARDADAMADVLEDQDIGGFAVTRMVDRTETDLRRSVARFLSARLVEDLVVLYLSCHGVLDRRGRLYFAATDTIRSELSATAVEASWLMDRLEECRARRQVLILDCCFSGAFARSKGPAEIDLEAKFVGAGRGRAVLTASRAGEYSFEGESLEGGIDTASVFTACLVDGLRSGLADRDGDGFISVEDAYTYAADEVRVRGGEQSPQRWLYGGEAEIILARNPRGVQTLPAILPEAVRIGLDNPYPSIRKGAVEKVGEWLASAEPAQVLAAHQILHRVASEETPVVAAAARDLLDGQKRTGRDGVTGPAVASAVDDADVASRSVDVTPLLGAVPIVSVGHGTIAAVSTGEDHQEIFVVDVHGKIFRRWADFTSPMWSGAESAWSAWSEVDAPERVTSIACSSLDVGHVEIFAVTGDGGLLHQWYWPDGGWSSWRVMATPGHVQAICAGSSRAREQDLIITLRDGSGAWIRSFPARGGYKWGPWCGLANSKSTESLAWSSLSVGHRELFAAGDGGLVHQWCDPGEDWSGWIPINVLGVVVALTAGPCLPGQQDLLVALDDGSLISRRYTPRSLWGHWERVEFFGKITGLTCSSLAEGHLEQFGASQDGRIQHRWRWHEEDWTAWRTF